MSPFWATLVKIGLLIIQASGHTVVATSGPTINFNDIRDRRRLNLDILRSGQPAIMKKTNHREGHKSEQFRSPSKKKKKKKEEL